MTAPTESAAILTDERILRLVCNHTGRRINMNQTEVAEHIAFARAIEADLRAALAAVPEQQPVAWANPDGLGRVARVRDGYADSPLLTVNATKDDWFPIPLYAAPVVLVDRNAVLEEAAALFPQQYMEYFGENIQADIRALKVP